MAESPALLLCQLLRQPQDGPELALARWSDALRCARPEGLAGILAYRLREEGVWDRLPEQVQAILEDAEIVAAHSHVVAGWEARQVMAALKPVSCPVILLKGSAYALAGLRAGRGRAAGDLDILLPRSYLGAAEVQLRAAGWDFVHTDPYDFHYYRTWMHELPPMIHRTRGTELDVHHTILPLTARSRPDAKALIRDARPLPGSPLLVLAPADMALHSAAHLFHGGDLIKPLRNLWDFHALLTEFGQDPAFWPALVERARRHGLLRTLAYALRYGARLFGTVIPRETAQAVAGSLPAQPLLWLMDQLFLAVFGQASMAETGPAAKIARFLLFIRAHWLKMPPLLLARHLWIKWRRQRRGATKRSSAGVSAEPQPRNPG